MAFGEADAVGVAEQRGVEVGDGGQVERALEQDLAGGGFEQVGAADDFGDALVGVVDDAGELVAGQADVGGVAGERATPDEEVAEGIFGCGGGVSGGEGLGAEVAVGEAYGFAVGDAQAVVGGGEELRRGVGGAAAAGVEGFVVGMGIGVGVFVGRLRHLGQVAAGAGARIDVAGGEELFEGGAVGGQAGGLREHGRLPGDAEPGEVFEHGGDEFGAGALGVEVFVAEQEGAVVGAGAGGGGVERGSVAEVKQSGGGGREASDVRRGHGFDDRGSASQLSAVSGQRGG